MYDAILFIVASVRRRGDNQLLGALLPLHPRQPLHLGARVLDPHRLVAGAEPAPAHERGPRALLVAIPRRPPPGQDPQPGLGRVHAQRPRHDLAPALRGLHRRRVVEVPPPQQHAPRMPHDRALERLEHARLARMVGRVLDLEAAAALGAQLLERLVPRDVREVVAEKTTKKKDEVFELGSLVDQRANLVLLEKSRASAPPLTLGDWFWGESWPG